MAMIFLDLGNAYVVIIIACTILICSHFFNKVSEWTRVPSVLLLILLGIGLQFLLPLMSMDFGKMLELLGIVGLIMIVLEAALDLELSRKALPMVSRTLSIAFFALVLSSLAIAWLIQFFIEMSFLRALLYSTPLSIMSSAIIIPSVAGLGKVKRDFMVYESAFSDILGIMMFYFLIELLEEGGAEASIHFMVNLVVTVLVAVVASYILVYLFKDMKGHVRLFLLIAVLLLLYSAGKLLHLAPLLIILIFGMSLSNHQTVFKVFKNYFQKDDPIEKIQKEFHLITMETAFVVRTFFFVVFGLTIDLSTLLNLDVFVISVTILILLYVVRFALLWLLNRPSITPELWIAPRGLITILLFFGIPAAYQTPLFNPAILLYVIIISSVIMSIGLIRDGHKKKEVVEAESTAP